jgi:hypothetical protein
MADDYHTDLVRQILDEHAFDPNAYGLNDPAVVRATQSHYGSEGKDAPAGWNFSAQVPYPEIDMPSVAFRLRHDLPGETVSTWQPSNRDLLARALIEGLHVRPNWVEGLLGTRGMGQTAPPPTLLRGRLSDLTSFLDNPADMVQPGHLGGHMPMPAAGMFIGAGARSIDRAAIGDALRMEADGLSPVQIWRATGWGRGADGKWRFEIPDDTARMLTGSETEGRGKYTLGAVLDHPELFRHYPWLESLPVEIDHRYGPDLAGAYIPPADKEAGYGSIWLHPDGLDRRRTLLHEIQHAIQQNEGFASGASSTAFYGAPAFQLYRGRVQAIRDAGKVTRAEYSRRMGRDVPLNEYRDFVESTRNIAPHVDQAMRDRAIQEAYRRSAGEVEARNTEARADWDAAKRRAVPPDQSQAVPSNAQIVQVPGLPTYIPKGLLSPEAAIPAPSLPAAPGFRAPGVPPGLLAPPSIPPAPRVSLPPAPRVSLPPRLRREYQ